MIRDGNFIYDSPFLGSRNRNLDDMSRDVSINRSLNKNKNYEKNKLKQLSKNNKLTLNKSYSKKYQESSQIRDDIRYSRNRSTLNISIKKKKPKLIEENQTLSFNDFLPFKLNNDLKRQNSSKKIKLNNSKNKMIYNNSGKIKNIDKQDIVNNDSFNEFIGKDNKTSMIVNELKKLKAREKRLNQLFVKELK